MGAAKQKPKSLKDVDSSQTALFLRLFLVPFLWLSPIFLVLGGIAGLIILALICLLAATGSFVFLNKAGGFAGKLYGGHTPIYSIQEQYSAELSMASVQKMKGNFEDALLITESILTKEPSFNEALFIKAQILSEGFNDKAEAKKCLAEIFKTEPKSSSLYHWSESLYRELVKHS